MLTESEQSIITCLQHALGMEPFARMQAPDWTRVTGNDRLPSCFDVTGLATTSILTACQSLDALLAFHGKSPSGISVDRRLASLWFDRSLVPEGWQLPPAWDEIAGDYQAGDGWIRLHTNASHHRRAALGVLGCEGSRSRVSDAVAQWSASELESEIVAANGCAAMMLSREQWLQHPQGKSVSSEPLVAWESAGSDGSRWKPSTVDRPLGGLRVLDLTRVLAGPVATRFLAAFGADVVRIDPVDLWDDSSNAPEMTPGKRCAGLSLGRQSDRRTFINLLKNADLLIHGYRPGALDNLGFSEQVCRKINPQLKIVKLCAYGWSGPWAMRRGFDSLVQMSSGLAHAGSVWKHRDNPVPLPVQALDHATGYLAAAAALVALVRQDQSQCIFSARVSLARTAELLASHPNPDPQGSLQEMGLEDLQAGLEITPWGVARRLRFPFAIDMIPAYWSSPATTLRSGNPAWQASVLD